MEMYGFAKGFRIDEEAVIRWLALGMVVAMLGVTMVPIVAQSDACLVVYALDKTNDGQFAAGSGAITAGALIVTGLYTAEKISATVAGWSLVGLGIAA